MLFQGSIGIKIQPVWTELIRGSLELLFTLSCLIYTLCLMDGKGINIYF